ncbi:maleylpyruvate isomerase family mycothiol-dependent enzyme [Jiangella aurantiaca]|uniref:Maleylpyruvate isomerase family mycothiol-dependent enzyme n=1 Tax=Jiangella aurantiaca TaxID=2530373 RepID=A0A4R5AA42_9ACTN|nr:maleylpyruvate isomerase N-terminal domain-containing protein [Jiangella aurantiaca]TDD68515.1 maleylpyruvate isomerase family mycothiol-dependent enzyme [Jiangella aurantiaca]
MATRLGLDDHVTLLRHSGAALLDAAARAGLDAQVPTCPGWDVRALVTHQGMVHRWAAAHLRGERDHDTDASVAAARVAPDLLAWFGDGLDALLATIAATPDDAEAMVFLKDAPPPRRFWARRQAHETTIHGADALAAALGRAPSAAEIAVAPELAADGVDELLTGFITRGRGKLRTGEPYTIAVRATDTGDAWLLRVEPESLTTTAGAGTPADAELSGTAAQLYLGLWNRGDELTATGRPSVLRDWRDQVRVRWS